MPRASWRVYGPVGPNPVEEPPGPIRSPRCPQNPTTPRQSTNPPGPFAARDGAVGCFVWR